ncbi:hypothetical protein [Bradyrhizobium sp. LjRoot220]|uniref:hypothetical protein n=1 Tax=Bradyrhizobium sp. LjRoot220 TaxID=3342284 RepID=UPI003F5094C7
MADQGAVAGHPEVSAWRRQRLAVHQDAAKAFRVLRQQAVSQAFQQPEARSAMVSRSAWPSALHRASPAHAWYQPAAGRRAAARQELCRQAAAMRSAPAWWLPPVGAVCGRAELPSALAEVSDAGAALRRAEAFASARLPVAALQAVSAAAGERLRVAAVVSAAAGERLRVAAAVLGAVEGPQQEAEPAVRDAAEEPQQAAELAVASGAEAALRPVAAWAVPVAWQPAAARPLAAPWAFRPDRALPSPVRRRVARSARAKLMSRSAPPSERSWQAARCEGLS